ncbi:MAG: hypothetical protein KUL88_06275 [Rhizobium sp.]|nr:hypothetical protein [Rhizobium sp.]
MDLDNVAGVIVDDGCNKRIELAVKQPYQLIVAGPNCLLKLRILQRNRLEEQQQAGLGGDFECHFDNCPGERDEEKSASLHTTAARTDA